MTKFCPKMPADTVIKLIPGRADEDQVAGAALRAEAGQGDDGFGERAGQEGRKASTTVLRFFSKSNMSKFKLYVEITHFFTLT
jgi:hypothetical protein